jgi:hypothetical protein
MLINEPRFKSTVKNGRGNTGEKSTEHQNIEIIEMLCHASNTIEDTIQNTIKSSSAIKIYK